MPFTLSRLLAIVAIAVSASLTLAACGGGDDETTSPAPATTPAASTPSGGTSGETVSISETEFKLNPSTVTVKPGEVTFKVTNDGATVHNLEVEGPSGDEEIEGDLAPGQSGTLTVDLSKPGTYEMYCPVGNHKDLGMTGEIEVKG